jgi:GT2 family glycosyltransferase
MSATIAVLTTSHNRKETTLRCLSSLFGQSGMGDTEFVVYLVDDGCTDGTAEAVNASFPAVKVIRGDGNLYWNGGMRLAWANAAKERNFDFFLLLNDDDVLNPDAFHIMLKDYEDVLRTKGECIIVGAMADPDTRSTSYGGWIGDTLLSPDGRPKECTTFNGNLVLIPARIFQTIGMLDEGFTHGFGDTEYGWRATKAGFQCFVTSVHAGQCKSNPSGNAWANPEFPLRKRIRLFLGPKGLPPLEWYRYSRKIYGWKWPLSFAKLFFRLLFPAWWIRIKSR